MTTHASKFAALVFVAAVAFAPAASADFAIRYAQDAKAAFTDPAITSVDNFEEVFKGDARAKLNGDFVSPFSNPNPPEITYNASLDQTTLTFSGDAISVNPTTFHTVGYTQNSFVNSPTDFGTIGRKLDSFWSFMESPVGRIASPSIDMNYNIGSSKVTVTIRNDPETFDIFSVGYLITDTQFALADLNRTTLPPSAFNPSTIPDGTTLGPGGSASFDILAVPRGKFVTIFVDAKFSGPSSGNIYESLSGNWASLPTLVTPEPATGLLAAVAAAVATGWKTRRRLSNPPLRG